MFGWSAWMCKMPWNKDMVGRFIYVEDRELCLKQVESGAHQEIYFTNESTGEYNSSID